MNLEIKGKTLDIEFSWGAYGHRVTVMEWGGEKWDTLPEWDYVLCLLQTPFETLCNISSALFEEAVHAEEMARKLEIEMRFSDDADCVKCDTWQHYAEMKETENGFVCENCQIEEEN